VRFIYPQPASTAEYERVFCCPVLFGRKENAFTLDLSLLSTPILMANPILETCFEQYAQDFLAKMDCRNEHTRAVTRIILARLDDELRVSMALADLPHDYQEVIVLRNLQRLPFNEVAERMGRSRPAVQMLWMRAIRKLQESLGEAPQ